MTLLSEGRDMDWPSTLPPCPILRGVIERVAAAGADHAERMWANVGTYTYKCDICGTENVVQNYGDWACRQCLQGYTYEECHQITLTDAQFALLRNPPQWIPVSERLPEDGKIVLVWHYSEVKTAWLNHFTNGVAYFVQKDTGYTCEPTHWMPLPEPPEVK